MTPEMITALSAFVAAVGGIISAIFLNRKTSALLQYRMDEVEKRLDSHNHYASMFTQTSDRIAKMEKDIAVIRTTLDFLKDKT